MYTNIIDAASDHPRMVESDGVGHSKAKSSKASTGSRIQCSVQVELSVKMTNVEKKKSSIQILPRAQEAQTKGHEQERKERPARSSACCDSERNEKRTNA